MKRLFLLLRPIALLLPLLGLGAGMARAEDAAASGALDRGQLLSLLSRQVAAHYNLEGDLELDLIRPWSPPERTAAKWDVSILDYPSVPAPSMLLRCRLVADGDTASDVTLVLRAALWRDAWVAREPLIVGATFDPSVLDTRRVDLFRERDSLPATSGDRSLAFARAVPAGRLLTWHDVSRRPLVRKGGLVEVRAVDGLMTVTMKALALESGAQGETITVRNPESRRDFPATIIDENHVQINF
jgi:flagella basal body P-ring formation protein FlgA